MRAYKAAGEDRDAEELRAGACDAYRRAAERAESVGAPEAAESAYLRAAELSADEGEQAALTERAGRMAQDAGWYERAVGHLETAIAAQVGAGRVIDAARAIGSLGASLGLLGRGEEAITLIRQALASLEETAAPPEVVADLQVRLPPVPLGGELLVDGGVIDNLPVPEARRANPKGQLIAVDVAPPTGPRPHLDYGMSMSGWQAIDATVRGWRRGRGRARLPMLHSTVLGSMLIASTRDRDRVVEEGLADLYLSIDARNCGPFEWDAVQEVADVGYMASRERLAAWADEIGAPW